MRSDTEEAIFFEEQILEAEAPSEAEDLAWRGDVDAGFAAPWNDGMATARKGSASTRLEERYDDLGIERASPAESEILGTGVDALDEALEGGLPSGLLTEFAETAPSSGGQALLLHLLAGMRRAQRFVALVDGADGFDPQSTPEALLEHLLWVRCRSAEEGMKAADALLRDENLGMVVLDLRGCPERELRRVKPASWYRLQRLAERSSSHVCVFTPRPMIPSAQVRVALRSCLGVDALDRSIAELGERLEVEALRLRKREREAFPQLVKQAPRKAVG